MQLEGYEKLILFRNFRSAMKTSMASSFDPEHMSMLHEKLCKGLEHRDKELKSGELKVAEGAAGLLGIEANKFAPHIMASTDKGHVADRAAYVLTRIENMKPFHSLNSFVGKLYSHNLAQTAGLKIDWQNMDRESLSSAIESAKNGDKGALVEQIKSNLVPMLDTTKKESVADRIGSGLQDRLAEFRSQRKEEPAIQSHTRMKM